MSIFWDTPAIEGSLMPAHVCCQTEPHLRHSTLQSALFPSKTGARLRYSRRHPCGQPGWTDRVCAMASAARLAGHFGVDASHRARERRTHLTHWPAAECRGVSWVRSACGAAPLFLCHAIPEFRASAIRVLVHNPAAVMKAPSWDVTGHRQTVLRTALRGSHAALALAHAARGIFSTAGLGRKVR